MTATEPRTTSVNCFRCKKPFVISLDDLRDLIEKGAPNQGRPHCGCEPPRPGPHTAKSATSIRSKSDLILLAIAEHFPAGSNTGVLTADIVVAAWVDNKAAFGLDGHASAYPSDNRVLMELCKMKGRGLLTQPQEKHYALADAGRKIVAQLRSVK